MKIWRNGKTILYIKWLRLHSISKFTFKYFCICQIICVKKLIKDIFAKGSDFQMQFWVKLAFTRPLCKPVQSDQILSTVGWLTEILISKVIMDSWLDKSIMLFSSLRVNSRDFHGKVHYLNIGYFKNAM